MDANRNAQAQQRRAVSARVRASDAATFFNVLTGPKRLERVESVLPPHREGRFPPTETLSMFVAQALCAHRSCQKAVDDAALRRSGVGLSAGSTHTRRHTAERGCACPIRWCARLRSRSGRT